jgi:hypothetical protein
MAKNKQDSWGFDLTHFADGVRGAVMFREILEACGLPVTPKRRAAIKGLRTDQPLNERPFVWKREGLRLVTGANPISGAYRNAKQRDNELGYASYIGITGNAKDVAKLAKLISQRAESIKEETPHESRFID